MAEQCGCAGCASDSDCCGQNQNNPQYSSFCYPGTGNTFCTSVSDFCSAWVQGPNVTAGSVSIDGGLCSAKLRNNITTLAQACEACLEVHGQSSCSRCSVISQGDDGSGAFFIHWASSGPYQSADMADENTVNGFFVPGAVCSSGGQQLCDQSVGFQSTPKANLLANG